MRRASPANQCLLRYGLQTVTLAAARSLVCVAQASPLEELLRLLSLHHDGLLLPAEGLGHDLPPRLNLSLNLEDGFELGESKLAASKYALSLACHSR